MRRLQLQEKMYQLEDDVENRYASVDELSVKAPIDYLKGKK